MARKRAADGGIRTRAQPAPEKEKAPGIRLELAVDEKKIQAVLQKIEEDYRSGKLRKLLKHEHELAEHFDKRVERAIEKAGKDAPLILQTYDMIRKLGEGVLTEKEAEEAIKELRVGPMPLHSKLLGMPGLYGFGAMLTTKFANPHEVGHHIHYYMIKKAVETGQTDDPVLLSLYEKATALGYGLREAMGLLVTSKAQRAFAETIGEAFMNRTEPGLGYKALVTVNFAGMYSYWGALVSSWSFTRLMERDPETFREILTHPSIFFGTSVFKVAKGIDRELGLSKERMAGDWYENFLMPLVREAEKF